MGQPPRGPEPDVHGLLIWNRPRYHWAKGHWLRDNVAIVLLTTNSPGLGPVEEPWHCLPVHRGRTAG